MRINIIKYDQDNQIDESGGTLNGNLVLSRHPEENMEAVTKGYADNLGNNLNAGNFNSGLISSERLPSFTGDLSNTAGSNIFNLNTSGPTPGSYSRVEVNAKGISTNGDLVLSSNDIPNLSYTKFTNTPSDLSGWGITDAIPITGGTINTPLTLHADPSSEDHLLTKGYVDTFFENHTNITSGYIVKKAYPETPSGYLKANGAKVPKLSYPGLYSEIGDSYSNFGIVGAGRPWEQQYNINEAQSVVLNNWGSAGSLPTAVIYGATVVTKNKVYIIGFWNGSAYTGDVFLAGINTDGSLSNWNYDTSLPTIHFGAKAIVTKNRVYLIDGFSGDNTPTTTVYTAYIDEFGTIGTWQQSYSLPSNGGSNYVFSTGKRIYSIYGSVCHYANINLDGTISDWMIGPTLSQSVSGGVPVVTKNRVYFISGSDVYTSTISGDGVVSSDISTYGSLPGTKIKPGVIVTKNRVYLLGGFDGSVYTNTTYSAPINPDGTLGSWSSGPNLYLATGHINAVAIHNRVYIFGGHDGSQGRSGIQTAAFVGGLTDYSDYYQENNVNYQIPGSGRPWEQQSAINEYFSSDITGWTTSGTIPTSIDSSQPLVTKNKVYLLGGVSGSTTLDSVYTAPINSDGTLGSWTSSSALPDTRSSHSVVVTKNKVYIIGGVNNSNTFLDSTIYATINSDGTLGSWTTGTTIPTALGGCKAFVTRNKVYLIGGYTGSTYVSTVYTAPIDSDGVIGSWTLHNNLPININNVAVAITKNRVYVIGGVNGSGTSSASYTAGINADGSLTNWRQGPTLPASRVASSVFVTKARVYVLGGYNSGSVSSVYVANIYPDGHISAWGAWTSLSAGLSYSSLIVTKNNIYLLGGYTSASTSTIYKATIASVDTNNLETYYNGSITPVDSPASNSTTFQLPDYTNLDTNGIYHYIKT